MNEITEIELIRPQVTEENVKLRANVSFLRRWVDRLENEQNDKMMGKIRLQNQLDEAFNSLERQQSKLSQALNEKEVLQNELQQAERELKVLMEDCADLNQQLRRDQKNIFSSPSADEITKSRNYLLQSRSKELTLAQENRFLNEKLLGKFEELRESKLGEVECRKEVEKMKE